MFVCLRFWCFLSFPESSSNASQLFFCAGLPFCDVIAQSLRRTLELSGGPCVWMLGNKSLFIMTQLEEF